MHADFGPAEAPGPAADFGQYDEYYFADSPTNEYDFAEGPFGFDYAPGPFGEYEGSFSYLFVGPQRRCRCCLFVSPPGP